MANHYFTITGVATWLSLNEPDQYGAYTASIIPEVDDSYERLANVIPSLAEDEGIYVTMPDCLKELGEKAADYMNTQLETDAFHCSDPVFRAKTKEQPTLGPGMDRVFSGQRVHLTIEPRAYSFVTNDGREMDGVSMRLIAIRTA